MGNLLILLSGQWQKIRGRFMAINSFMMSCRCAMTPDGAAPCAHTGDGCTDLVLIRETSRANYVKFLLRCKDTKSDQVTQCLINVSSFLYSYVISI